MTKNTLNKIICLLFYVFIFCFLLNISFYYLDSDFGWHLKIGQDILTERQVPHINYYNYTIYKTRWVDHEWLTNAFVYWLYQSHGYIIVNIFFAAIVLLAFILLYYFTVKYYLKEKGGYFLIFIFQLLALLSIMPHLGVRMQEISLLNLLLLFIIIKVFEKNGKTIILFWLLPLFYLWANLHGGFLIGLFVLFFWLMVKIIELILLKYKKLFFFIDFSNILATQKIKNFFIFTVLSVVITFFTPYKFELYKFLSGYKNSFYLKAIAEWLPIYNPPVSVFKLFYLAIITIMLALIIINSFRKTAKRKEDEEKNKSFKINLWQILITIFFIAISIKSVRHFPLFFMASFPFLIEFYSKYLSIPQSILNSYKKSLFFVKIYLSLCLLAIIIIFCLKINFISNPFSSFCYAYPCKATKFLKNDARYKDLVLFNHYSWGGFLLWVWPKKQLFIDGRFPQCQFAEHSLLEEYYEFFDKEKMEDKLSQHNIQLILLNKPIPYKPNWFEKYIMLLKEEEINKNLNETIHTLNNLNNWRLIYEDDISVIYAKNI